MMRHNTYCTQQKNYTMHYLKSGLAGFDMSFIGTALCGAKTGTHEILSYKARIQKNVYFNFARHMNQSSVEYYVKEYCLGVTKDTEGKQQFDWNNFKYDQYYDDTYGTQDSNWYNSNFKEWSVAKAFLINNAWSIPTSLLGALFHDKVGRDLTPKINDYFDSDISPYLVTGGIFTAIGTLGMGLNLIAFNTFDFSQPWIYSMSLIEGFLIGATAMAGAYFGDEKTDEIINPEFTNEINCF